MQIRSLMLTKNCVFMLHGWCQYVRKWKDSLHWLLLIVDASFSSSGLLGFYELLTLLYFIVGCIWAPRLYENLSKRGPMHDVSILPRGAQWSRVKMLLSAPHVRAVYSVSSTTSNDFWTGLILNRSCKGKAVFSLPVCFGINNPFLVVRSGLFFIKKQHIPSH